MTSGPAGDGKGAGSTAGRNDYIEPDLDECSPSPGSEEGDGASTRSLTQSMFNFPTENGRRYHKFHEGCYHYPNDEVEMERMDLQYEIMRIAMGDREFFCPLNDPKKILDVGTGTGTWPIAMGDMFPDCEIIGTDLSPIQPNWVPDNVRFVLDDASEEDWLYAPGTFDLIHTRSMLGSFEDFREILKKSFKYVKPGGWMESQEWMPVCYCDDGTMPPDWPFADWHRTMDLASMQLDRPLRIANKLKRWFREAGFVDVHEEVFKVPCNAWPRDSHLKNLGKMNELTFIEGVQGLSMGVFYRGLGWTKDEIELYLVNVRKSLRDRSVHAYSKVYVVWGRKPEDTA